MQMNKPNENRNQREEKEEGEKREAKTPQNRLSFIDASNARLEKHRQTQAA